MSTLGNIKNLGNEEAIAKLKELAEGINICMFCTDLKLAPFATRPMAIQEVDANGYLWFLSGADSHKNLEIKEDEKVQLIFGDTSKYHFLTVYGDAYDVKDREKIENLWTPIASAWFKEGKDDPNVTLICVKPIIAYYWDTKDGKVVSLFKIAKAALTGSMDDGGIEGTLRL